jgi:hypothetical protein
MCGVLPEAIIHRRWKADFSHIVNETVERDFPRLIQCLDQQREAVKRGYVRGDVLKKNLEVLQGRLLGPTCEVAWSLSDLLGLELWLRVFFGESNNGKEVLADRGSGPKLDMITGGKR